jgi:hypothetical protein
MRHLEHLQVREQADQISRQIPSAFGRLNEEKLNGFVHILSSKGLKTTTEIF